MALHQEKTGFRTGKVFATLAMLALFAAVLLVVNVLHFRLVEVHVVLYAALTDALVAAALTAAAGGVWFRGLLSGFEASLILGICLLSGYIFAISVPTVIDRSLSIYILEKIAQRGGAVRQDAMASIFIEEYLPEHRLVDVRLTEQQASGTITIEDGCIRLTSRGRRLARLSRLYRTHLLPRKRILMGEITDALTDPFRTSAPANEGTMCK